MFGFGFNLKLKVLWNKSCNRLQIYFLIKRVIPNLLKKKLTGVGDKKEVDQQREVLLSNDEFFF